MSVARSLPVGAASGYSGKPVWQKLGLRPGLRVWLRHAPPDYWTFCGFDPAALTVVAATARRFDFGHLFAASRTILARDLAAAARKLDADGMLWISWPKKSSGVSTDIDESALREMALPLGLVDVKVCAVTPVWSGLKFIWRRSRRPAIA